VRSIGLLALNYDCRRNRFNNPSPICAHHTQVSLSLNGPWWKSKEYYAGQ